MKKIALGAAIVLAAILAGALLVDRAFFSGVAVGVIIPSALVGLAFWWLQRMATNAQSNLDAPPIPVGTYDYAWTIKDLDGVDVPIGRARGKVLFVNFWATWCGPCVAEMPSLQRLYEKVRDEEAFFACVTIESADVARTFLAQKGLAVPVFTTTENGVPEMFKTRGIPATFVVDKRGRLAFSHIGAARWDDERVIEFVRMLAAMPSL